MLRAYFKMALLLSALAGVALIKLAAANFIPEVPPNAICIKANSGNVEPATAPIKREGNVYKLTGNINQPIMIQRSNIILDGAGFTLRGNGSYSGIEMSHRANVTITNIHIKSFYYGIFCYASFDNTISGNTIMENNASGIYLIGAQNNIISDNIIENNGAGIHCTGSSFHYSSHIVDNIVRHNDGFGICYDADIILNDNVVENNGVNFSLFDPEATPQPTPAIAPTSKPIASPELTPEPESFPSSLVLASSVTVAVVCIGLGLLAYLIKRK